MTPGGNPVKPGGGPNPGGGPPVQAAADVVVVTVLAALLLLEDVLVDSLYARPINSPAARRSIPDCMAVHFMSWLPSFVRNPPTLRVAQKESRNV